MAEKNNTGGLAKEMLTKKVRSFMIGDKVEVESEPHVFEVVTIEQFYPHLVLYRRKNGTVFTLDYFDAAQARLVKRSKFQVHTERMDQEAVLQSLGDQKIGGDKDG